MIASLAEAVPMGNLLKVALPVISFLLSIYTLYITQWRRACLKIFIGEHLNLGHFIEGNFQITLPITFINDGARLGVIRSVSLLIQGPNIDDGYLLEPYFIQKINDAGHFQHESQPAPITIAGKQTITKQILFRSSPIRPTEFRLLNKGTYVLTLLCWTGDSNNPGAMAATRLNISHETAVKLNADFKKTSNTTRVIHDDWAATPLTSKQIARALKQA